MVSYQGLEMDFSLSKMKGRTKAVKVRFPVACLHYISTLPTAMTAIGSPIQCSIASAQVGIVGKKEQGAA